MFGKNPFIAFLFLKPPFAKMAEGKYKKKGNENEL